MTDVTEDPQKPGETFAASRTLKNDPLDHFLICMATQKAPYGIIHTELQISISQNYKIITEDLQILMPYLPDFLHT